MQIGEPKRTIVVEPLDDPVPRELPEEPPAVRPEKAEKREKEPA